MKNCYYTNSYKLFLSLDKFEQTNFCHNFHANDRKSRSIFFPFSVGIVQRLSKISYLFSNKFHHTNEKSLSVPINMNHFRTQFYSNFSIDFVERLNRRRTEIIKVHANEVLLFVGDWNILKRLNRLKIDFVFEDRRGRSRSVSCRDYLRWMTYPPLILSSYWSSSIARLHD